MHRTEPPVGVHWPGPGPSYASRCLLRPLLRPKHMRSAEACASPLPPTSLPPTSTPTPHRARPTELRPLGAVCCALSCFCHSDWPSQAPLPSAFMWLFSILPVLHQLRLPSITCPKTHLICPLVQTTSMAATGLLPDHSVPGGLMSHPNPHPTGCPPTELAGRPLRLCIHVILPSPQPWGVGRSNLSPYVPDKETGAPRVSCPSKVTRPESGRAGPSSMPASALAPRCLFASPCHSLSPLVAEQWGTQRDPDQHLSDSHIRTAKLKRTPVPASPCCQFSTCKTGTRTA